MTERPSSITDEQVKAALDAWNCVWECDASYDLTEDAMRAALEAAEALRPQDHDYGSLLFILADIREALGVGHRPSLTDLPRIVRERCAADARTDAALLAALLEPIERAVEAVESVDPLCPDECAALRAAFDYWTRNLGRDNSEEVHRESVRFGDLKRLRDFRRAIVAQERCAASKGEG